MTTVRHEVGSFSFEWDSAKAEANRRKHGVSFEEAASVFLDPLGRWMDDPDDAKGEVRLLLLSLRPLPTSRLAFPEHAGRWAKQRPRRFLLPS